jgi:serine/threonine protein kinase
VGVGGLSNVRTAGEILADKRNYFISLIRKAGVKMPVTKKENEEFDKVMDKLYFTYSQQADSCTSPHIAKFLYDRVKRIPGTATKLMYAEQGLDLDVLLPNVFSNKAILQIIFYKNVPHVFKYPTTKDYHYSIVRDYNFCNTIKERNNGILPEGLVYYQPFSITTTNNEEISGSISQLYVLSMNNLSYPVSEQLLVHMCNRLVPAIRAVHQCGFVINDIKPSNIFMHSNGNVDIGDFGAATPVGTSLIEISYEYAPMELVESNIAIPTMDWMCLINSLLEMRNLPKRDSCENIIESVTSLSESHLKDVYLSLIRYCALK